MSLKDNAPPWVKERRQPTKEELSAKHFADGGKVAQRALTPEEIAADNEFWGSDKPLVVKRFNK